MSKKKILSIFVVVLACLLCSALVLVISRLYEKGISENCYEKFEIEEQMLFDEPEIIRQGGKYGVRLKASAPAIHIMKTTVNAEVAPIVGSQKQSQELVMYMMSDYENEPEKIWQSNIFGKSLHELVNEGLITKMNTLPDDARRKLRETVERMINEGCSGLICFIL